MFYSIQDILAAEAEAPSAQVRNDIPVHHIRKALYYNTLLKYLKARIIRMMSGRKNPYATS